MAATSPLAMHATIIREHSHSSSSTSRTGNSSTSRIENAEPQLQIQSQPQPQNPPQTPSKPSAPLYRDVYSAHHAPSAAELQQMRSTTIPSVPPTPGIYAQTDPLLSHTEDIELQSRPGSPSRGSNVAVAHVQNLQTLKHPKNMPRFILSCVEYFTYGLNDSAPGALLPYIEAAYGLSYTQVSLVFIMNAVGFISAAPIIHPIQRRIGRVWLNTLSQGLLVLGYVLIVSEPPFGLVVFAFWCLGMAMALSLSPNNIFITRLQNGTRLMGFGHGCYGLGGVCGPLIATALVSHGARWADFYILTLSCGVFNLLFGMWCLRGYEKDHPVEPVVEVSRPPSRRVSPPAAEAETENHNENEPALQPVPAPAQTLAAKKSWKQRYAAFINPVTLLGAPFICAYQGAEVSISGWVISFLLSYRVAPNFDSYPPTGPPAGSSGSGDSLTSLAALANPSVGYVTAGFWGGITLGRMLLSEPCHRYGEIRAIYLLTFLSAALQLLIWLLPSLIAEGVVVAIVGLFLGPIYPCATMVMARLIERKHQTKAFGIVTAVGSSGGAFAPFIVGVIGGSKGVWVLNPVCLACYAVMAMLWVGVHMRSREVERKRAL